MTPELKTKWIEALRSGRYIQGRQALRNGDEFCCLGVLCDIAGAEWKARKDYLESYEASLSGEEMEDVLGPNMRESVGLSESNMNVLWTLNDDGASFEKIADHIEGNRTI